MMEVQQQHSPVGVGPLDFSRRGVAEASAFRVVKPKQPASSLVHQQPLPPETNNNENLQENPQIPVDAEGKGDPKLPLNVNPSVIRLQQLSTTDVIARQLSTRASSPNILVILILS